MQIEAKVCDAVAREPLSEETPVRDLMTMRALTIPPDAEVTEAAHIHAQRPGTADAPLSGSPLPIRFGDRYPVRNARIKV
jgi:CBS domain-containing protein